MTQLIPSSSKKRITPVNVVVIIDVEQKMLGVCIEGYIVSKYGFANVWLECEVLHIGAQF